MTEIEKNLNKEKLEFTHFLNFWTSRKTEAGAFEAVDFLNIFLRFLSF